MKILIAIRILFFKKNSRDKETVPDQLHPEKSLYSSLQAKQFCQEQNKSKCMKSMAPEKLT